MTTDQYAALAEDYEKVKDMPWSRHLEQFTFLRAIGDVRGKSILDVACGTGYYTRLLRRNGGAEVVGVDVSEAMIGVARSKETTAPLGVTYHVHDVSNMPKFGSFDLVASAFLLNYATGEAMLTAMCQRILDNLADNGMFVYFGVNPYGRHEKESHAKFEKYGLKLISVTPTASGGLEIRVSWPPGPVSFVVYQLPMSTYERALERAGFAEVEWIPLEVSDEGVKEFGEEFWADALDNPLITAMRASR